MKQLTHIGKNCLIDIVGHATGVPAKTDTGADSSSIWASNVSVDKNGVLHFVLFGKGSKWYTGDVITRSDFTVAKVRSSSGHMQIRYRTHFTTIIEGKRLKVLFNLSDRSQNNYPVLIGRRTIAGKFLVDVTKGSENTKLFSLKSLNQELQEDPYAFYKKYHSKNVEE